MLTDDDGGIVAGHGRVEVAKRLGLATVPTIRLVHLSADERRAYVLADNKLAANAGWDDDLLAIELQGLLDVDFDLDVIGFTAAEVDIVIDGIGGDPAAVKSVAVEPAATEPVALLFTVPPYNVPIDGHVCGSGSVRHRKFAEGCGEMSERQFTAFLTDTLGAAASVLRSGAIAYVCMDWRHIGEIVAAGRAVFTELKNVCVWNKTNGGMGTFYRSKHELVFVWKHGRGRHTNNFGLGKRSGRGARARRVPVRKVRTRRVPVLPAAQRTVVARSAATAPTCGTMRASRRPGRTGPSSWRCTPRSSRSR